MNKSGSYPLLDSINSPADVRKLNKSQLKPLAKELREYLT
ncbi:MAG: 1-deoxy-D-xylulose-5-phosphate synthase N-terminal domain-containing protein, partial [Gammaproteobacteria bacterium]